MIDNNYEEPRQPYPVTNEPEPEETEETEETGEEESVEEEPGDAVSIWFEERADARADVDTAIAVYGFLEELDLQSPDVLKWNLKRRLTQTKKNCLLIICKSIDELTIEKDETEDE